MEIQKIRYETNVPPGVGAEVVLDQMNQDQLLNMGRKVMNFVSSAMRNPETRAVIDAEVEKLRASGWFRKMGVEDDG